LLYKPTFESVCYVAANMRAADKEEILPLRFDPSPESLARTVMSDVRYCWLAAHGADPVAVFGMFEVRPKAWTAFAFGTDNFPKVAGEMTKYLVRKVKPHLFNDLEAARIEAYSHADHTQAHAWLRLLGAKGRYEPEYGPDGQTYMHFVLTRSDFLLSEQEKADRIVVTGGESPLPSGGTPGFASSAISRAA
jgi:hypothetical protein